MNIKCSDPNHSKRSSEPDWRDVVAIGDKPGGMVCEACARLRKAEAVPQKAHAEAATTIYGSDVYTVSWPRKYADGTFVESDGKKGSLADKLTMPEIAALKTLLDKLLEKGK